LHAVIVNPFDTAVLHFLNRFSQRFWAMDNVVVWMSEDSVARGGLITGMLWWAWFRKSENKERDREIVTSGILVSVIALVLARILAVSLPFRNRPFTIPELHIVAPETARYFDLVNWSSFPSDHAVLYFSLATCIFFVSRKVGVVAFLHAFFIASLPRVYIGLHYPTDVIAGALLGIGIATVCLRTRLAPAIARPPLAVLKQAPGAFYMLFYLCTFSLSTNFSSVRWMAAFCWHVVHPASHGSLPAGF
jgi:undecaprenyl-diphosphatase